MLRRLHLYRFLAIAVLLDVKDIPQIGPLQWERITGAGLAAKLCLSFHLVDDGLQVFFEFAGSLDSLAIDIRFVD